PRTTRHPDDRGPRPAPRRTPLADVAVEELARALLDLRRPLALERVDARQQRLVIGELLLVAELSERRQAGGLDLGELAGVEQDVARPRLHAVGLECVQARRRDLAVLAVLALVEQHLL